MWVASRFALFPCNLNQQRRPLPFLSSTGEQIVPQLSVRLSFTRNMGWHSAAFNLPEPYIAKCTFVHRPFLFLYQFAGKKLMCEEAFNFSSSLIREVVNHVFETHFDFSLNSCHLTASTHTDSNNYTPIKMYLVFALFNLKYFLVFLFEI